MINSSGRTTKCHIESESEMLDILPTTKNANNSGKAGENDDFTVIKQGVRREKTMAGSAAR